MSNPNTYTDGMIGIRQALGMVNRATDVYVVFGMGEGREMSVRVTKTAARRTLRMSRKMGNRKVWMQEMESSVYLGTSPHKNEKNFS
jgi:hypothetical protein